MKANGEYYVNNETDGTFGMLINKNIFQDIIKFAEDLKIPIDTSISKYILSNNKYKTYGHFPSFNYFRCIITIKIQMVLKGI